MKSAILWSALSTVTASTVIASTIIAAPLAAQNVEPLPPQGQPTQVPAPSSQPAQTTNPPLPGQTAPRPYPVPGAPQTSQPATQQQQPAQLPYEQTGDQSQPSYQPSVPSYAPPPAPPPPSYKSSDFTTVVDLVTESPAHTRLAQLVKQDALVDALKATGPFTLFAPSNAAFMAMDQAELAELLKPESKAELDRLLKYHVVKGYLASSELVKQLKRNGGKGSLPTLAGQTLIAGLSPEGKVTLTDPEGHVATITSYDQPAFNGLVHVTNAVMVPAKPEDPKAKKKKRR